MNEIDESEYCEYCEEYAVSKAIYAGLPGRYCTACSALTGPAFWLAQYWFNGAIVLYTGSYWRVLWAFLCGRLNEEANL